MKRPFFAFLFAASIFSVAQTPQKSTEPIGRFLLASAQAAIDLGAGETHGVFLIDTQTSRLRRLQPGAPGLAEDVKASSHEGEKFLPVVLVSLDKAKGDFVQSDRPVAAK